MHRTIIDAFTCPHCGCVIRRAQRLPYPRAVIGRYAPVYRCDGCHRHTGEPVGLLIDQTPVAGTAVIAAVEVTR